MEGQATIKPVAQPPAEKEPVAPPPPLQAQLDSAAKAPEPQAKEAPQTPAEKAIAAWKKVQADREAKLKAAEAPPVEAPKVEATPPAPALTEPPKPPEEPLSTSFARLAKVERQAREAMKTAKAAQEAAEKRAAELQAKLDAQEKAKAEAKTNVNAWLAQAGLTYEDVAQFQMNGQKPTPELVASRNADEVAQLKKQQEEFIAGQKKAEEERSRRAYQEQMDTWRRGIVDFVKANASKYELIEQQGAHQLVAQVIEEQYRQTQKVLSETEAADLVEGHLEKEAEKLLSTKKLQAKLKPAAPPAPAAQPGEPTITNGLTASTHTQNGARPKDWEAVKERARLAMEKARNRV